jgi:hypothetical protein
MSATISIRIVRLFFSHEEAMGSIGCWTTLPIWEGVREELVAGNHDKQHAGSAKAPRFHQTRG